MFKMLIVMIYLYIKTVYIIIIVCFTQTVYTTHLILFVTILLDNPVINIS